MKQSNGVFLRIIQILGVQSDSYLSMFYLDDQSMIRHFGLIYIQRFELPELLYAIDPAYQRQGLTVEAAQQALVWGHET